VQISNIACVVQKGISQERAKFTLERDGPNELSPPRTTPEWVRLSKHMFSGFSILLWTAALLSLIVFSAQAATLEEPPGDNVRFSLRFLKKILFHGIYHRLSKGIIQ